ncbi:MAG: DUF3108 domain-containing protein [Candidatus Omnitrophica bacterium]|nr:DUF3108 domain-containing protein [Candidatus Omnitrophota bacterium]
MKKIFIILISLFLFSGCARRKKEPDIAKIPEVFLPEEIEIKEKSEEISKETPEEKEVEISIVEKTEEKNLEKNRTKEEKKIVLSPIKKITPTIKEEKEKLEILQPKIFIDFWNGECLIYNLKLGSLNLGKGIFLCLEDGGNYRIIGITIPSGLPAYLDYGYNRIDSFIDKNTGKVKYCYLYSKTGKTEEITEIFFNWPSNQYNMIKRKLKDKKLISSERNTIKFEGDIFDCLSTFYLLRNIESENFKNLEIPIALKEIWYLRVNIREKSPKKLPNGEIKEVFVIEPYIRSAKKDFKKQKINMWITTDNEKLPVLCEGLLPLGKATMILAETRKINIDSKIDINKTVENIIKTLF